MANSDPGAKVFLADIEKELPDEMARKMIPGYDHNHFSDYVKLTPKQDNTCAHRLIVDFTNVNFAVSASDAGTLDALLIAASGFFDLVGVSNPKTIINHALTILKGVKNAYKVENVDDEQKVQFYVTPCCHLGPQPFTVTLNVTGNWLITDKGDNDEIVNLTGYLDACGYKDKISLHADGKDAGAGSSQLFVATASVSFETDTGFLVVIYLHEDCHTDGMLSLLTDAVSAIKITDIQIIIETDQECKKREKTAPSQPPNGEGKKKIPTPKSYEGQ
jgi:hypothetical protein